MANNEFFKLDYTHEQIEEMLSKLENGFVLTEKEHNFLKELMGLASNTPEDEEEEVAPIDPDDFVTKDEIMDYVNNSLKNAGAATKEDISNLQDDISTLHNQDIENLRIELAEKINVAISNEIGDLEDYVGSALDQVEGALEQLESNLDRIEEALEQVEDVIKPDDSDKPSVELPSDLLNRIENLEQTTGNLVDSSNTLVNTTNSLRTRMNNIESTTSSLETRISNLENNSGGDTGESIPSDELYTLTSKVNSLEITVNSFESSINTLETNYTDLKETVDGLSFEFDPSAIDERFKKLENMLDTPASYTRPTVSISAAPTLIESGAETSVTVTPKFAQNDAGAMTSCVIAGSPSGNKTSLSSFKDNLTLAHNATITYTVTVNHAEGPKKTTSMGNVDNNNIKAGSISNTVSVRAVAASYSGAINTASLSDSDIVTLSKSIRNTKGSTVIYNLNNQRSVFMYPSSFGTISSIKDANGFDYIDSYTLTKMTYNDVEYNVYIMKEPTTITGFKQIFS